ncbi:MAG: lamin tail domain-containing protein [Flavobacteriales bacterium]
MTLRNLFSTLFFTLTLTFYGQITDNFSDGDFTQNPVWQGTSADFIVNASGELQLNSVAAGTSYLSTPHLLSNLNDKEWQIKVRQTFSPSSSNYGRVYLTSDNANLSLCQNGYYLQFGETGSTDAIRLFNLTNGVATQICAGIDGQIASSFNASVKVKRDASGLWSLYADLTGSTNYTLLSSGTDASSLLGTHFGMLCTYTISNATKFYFDNVYIGPIVLDLTPPILVSVTPISASQIDMLFDESVTMASAQNIINYSFNPSLTLSNLAQDGVNTSLVHGTLSTLLVNGTSYTVTANGIIDLSGNTSGATSTNFQYLVSDSAVKGDLLITEFFPDPSPVIGLPAVEYVEIYNASAGKIFDLTGYHITDGPSNGLITSGWILPGEYKVLTATANIPLFTTTTALGVTSFPSLNNAGDTVMLKNPSNQPLDLVVYTDDWYKDAIKQDGGYSLELINPNDPCSDENNWMASNDASGGTPGLVNSVYDLTPDTQAPSISLMVASGPNYLQIWFDEGMDSSSLVNALYQFSPTLTPSMIYANETYTNTVILQFSQALAPSQIYTLTLQNAADCWINSQTLTGQFALTETPISGEIVINEILQNPYNGGQDWIELYNNSNKIFNLKNLQFANFDNDTIANFKTVNGNFMLKPGAYAVLGKDSSFVKQNYPFHGVGTFVYTELPTYNNDSGSVYVYNENQVLLDLVKYTNEWQFPLLDDVDGVSLERMDPNGVSSDGMNWHSAAEAIQFGTPGLKNSQYLPVSVNGNFELENDLFSPDMDGHQDVMQASYQLSQANCLGTVTIYDERGRFVRTLFKNQLMGTTGTFSWNGVKEDSTKASIGVYVIVFEVFSLDGGLIYTGRKAVTVAGNI